MSAELRQKLEKIAARDAWIDADDFCPCDYCGSNYDDAYYGGSEDGEVLLARSLLKEFG